MNWGWQDLCRNKKDLTYLNYFFLNPLGHFGLLEVIFLVVAPLRQVIVLLIAGVASFAGLVLSAFAGACDSCTRMVGDENVKLSACNLMKPFFSLIKVVAIWLVLSAETISTFA